MKMLDCYQSLTHEVFPSDPREQLAAAAAAVFRSWDAPKAATYRRLNGISDDAGTAVTVQTMVYGNAGAPRGLASPSPEIQLRALANSTSTSGSMHRAKISWPGVSVLATTNDFARRCLAFWTQLNEVSQQLEALAGDAQDFEFTVQSGVLYLLQTRRAKRTDWAALTHRKQIWLKRDC